mmetsp:Transcript_4614/g.9507  ORF Transcript_4614/g.9507 Transcript_4614/m.9507 type:complete len:115 (+) Transcript_4614:1561-1905(+)
MSLTTVQGMNKCLEENNTPSSAEGCSELSSEGLRLMEGVRGNEPLGLAGVSKESLSGGRTRLGSKKYSTLALPVTKSTVRALGPLALGVIILALGLASIGVVVPSSGSLLHDPL